MADEGQAGSDVPTSRTPNSGVPVTDHELIRLIGRGSYGEVWLAKNALGKFRAIKIVHEKTFRDKRPFEREFNGVQKFEPVSRLHEGLMDILQVGRDDAAGYFYCVMELADDVVSGQEINPEKYSPRTLAHDLTERRRLPIEECQRVGKTIASALEFLHARSLVHRDVKPTNVVFVNGVPKLADIGLVAELSSARSYVGTDGFIPPEGPGTVQADIYSFGKVLYEISTGKDRHDYPEPATSVEDPAQEKGMIEFNKIILKACRADTRQRYQSVAALRADLELLADGGSSAVRTRGRLARGTLKLAGALCVCALAAVMLASARTRTNRSPVPAPSGLVAWWRAEGNADNAMGTNKGTFANGIHFARGKTGQAFVFNGINQLITVPSSPALNLTNSLTLEGWVYVSGYPTNDVAAIALKLLRSPDAQYCLGLGNFYGQWYFCPAVHVPTGNAGFPGTTRVQLNTWYHVAMTYDNAALKLYVNGGLEKSMALSGQIKASALPFVIGGNPTHPRWCFNGRVDELSLYDRALSPVEVRAIFQAGSAGKCISNTPPFISVQPAPQKVMEGETATLTVLPGGAWPLTCQWSCNGTNLPGASRCCLELTNVQPDQAGVYSVRVTNALGSIFSSNARLEVVPRPKRVPAPPGLVSWWSAEGNANDRVGGNNGELVGAASFAPGKVGRAFSLDGVNAHIKIPRAANLDIGDQLTVEFWMKADPANKLDHHQGLFASDYYVVDIANGFEWSREGVLFAVAPEGLLPDSWRRNCPNTADINRGGAIITAGQWHHIAGTYDGRQVQLYIDGMPWGKPALCSGKIAPMLTNSFVSIGSHDGRTACPECMGNRFYKGLIDEVSIYNRALTAAEIKAIYDANSAGKFISSDRVAPREAFTPTTVLAQKSSN